MILPESATRHCLQAPIICILGELKPTPIAGRPMTEFDEQLKQAIQRGIQTNEARQREAAQQQLNAEDLKRRHTEFRLAISERIEKTLQSLVNQLPGFEYENIYGDRGWGGAVSRDELSISHGKRNNVYSRLEITVKPFTELGIVNMNAKGTIKNKEMFTRRHHDPVQEADMEQFLSMVDRWVLEYAQLYTAADAV